MASSYQYGTSPRKLEPEYERKTSKKVGTQKSKAKSSTNKVTTKKNNVGAKPRTKKAIKAKYNYKPLVYILLAFIMLFAISYRNSVINESYNEKEKIKTELSAVKKENEQLRVNIENNLNLSSVEKTAEDMLGMQKLSNDQKVYIDLQKKDYVETATEVVVMNTNLSWWEKVLNKLTEIIK